MSGASCWLMCRRRWRTGGAFDALRFRLRTVPIAQQPFVAEFRTVISDRWGERDAGHGTFGRTDHGSSLGSFAFLSQRRPCAPCRHVVGRRFYTLRKPCILFAFAGTPFLNDFIFYVMKHRFVSGCFGFIIFIPIFAFTFHAEKGFFMWRHGKKL